MFEQKYRAILPEIKAIWFMFGRVALIQSE